MSSRTSRLRLDHAVVLGLLHGPAELLPISSSGHLTVVPWLLRWEYAELDDDLRKAFEVALHAGTGVALAIALRRELADMLKVDGLCFLALSAAPPALAGYALERPIKRHLGTPSTVAAGLIAGAVALAVADRAEPTRRPATANSRDALWLGVAQAGALFPGVSRSGATLTAARLRGFGHRDAARVSWQVALAPIAGATLLEGLRMRRRLRALATPFAAGAAAAFVSTLTTSRLLRQPGRDRPLHPFALYRLVLATAVLARLRADAGQDLPARRRGGAK